MDTLAATEPTTTDDLPRPPVGIPLCGL